MGLRERPRGQPILPDRGAQPGRRAYNVLPFGMGIDGMDLCGLLAEQFHDPIIFRAQLPVVRGVAVPQDVMRYAFGDEPQEHLLEGERQYLTLTSLGTHLTAQLYQDL